MKIQKLGGTDGFIVFDLDDAPHNIGVTRLAPKILQDGATLLARSNTYLFAVFEQQVGGASAGINAKPEDREAAIAAFIEEVSPLVESGSFLTDPGRGLGPADLEPLRALDPRRPVGAHEVRSLLGISVAVAADRAVGGLEGRTVAVEGLDASNARLLTELAFRGALVTAVASTKGTVSDGTGLDVPAVVAAFAEHGPAAVESLGSEVGPATAVLALDADALLVGSKTGLIDHTVAASVTARVVVPTGPIPVTAKGLAVLRRAGVSVLPDFVTISGPMFAAFPAEGATIEDVWATVHDNVAGVVDEVLSHDDGPLLAACYRAEAFLKTWQDKLPFGRPLA